MKIVDGENPLDATWIHPESYQTALALLEKFEMTVDDLRSEEQRAKLGEKTKDADVAALAKELGVGPRASRYPFGTGNAVRILVRRIVSIFKSLIK